VSVIGLVVTAAASFVLIPRYGASGAAVASTIGYLAGGLAAWITFVRLAGLGLGVTLRLPVREPD
jgi:O-antigen/teichoic acid export membrane protein